MDCKSLCKTYFMKSTHYLIIRIDIFQDSYLLNWMVSRWKFYFYPSRIDTYDHDSMLFVYSLKANWNLNQLPTLSKKKSRNHISLLLFNEKLKPGKPLTHKHNSRTVCLFLLLWVYFQCINRKSFIRKIYVNAIGRMAASIHGIFKN
jgi:hypothetical protein